MSRERRRPSGDKRIIMQQDEQPTQPMMSGEEARRLFLDGINAFMNRGGKGQ